MWSAEYDISFHNQGYFEHLHILSLKVPEIYYILLRKHKIFYREDKKQSIAFENKKERMFGHLNLTLNAGLADEDLSSHFDINIGLPSIGVLSSFKASVT